MPVVESKTIDCESRGGGTSPVGLRLVQALADVGSDAAVSASAVVVAEAVVAAATTAVVAADSLPHTARPRARARGYGFHHVASTGEAYETWEQPKGQYWKLFEHTGSVLLGCGSSNPAGLLFALATEEPQGHTSPCDRDVQVPVMVPNQSVTSI